jgi:polysaccharide biosynthesis/export protein
MKGWQLLTMLVALLGAARAVAAPPAADYRFAPGDVIEVTVAPQHGFDRTITVQPDGKISYPVVRELQVAGLTVTELAEKLRQGLNRDLVDPVVTVTLREAGKREVGRITLLGAVRNQAGVEIKEGTTLTEVLALSGGPTPDADLRHVKITHADGSVTTVDLAAAEATGHVDRTTILRPGDIVLVPEGPPATVLVLGEVAKTGPYPIPREARLMDAIAQAGGLTEKADLSRVTLTRSGAPVSQTLDLQPLLRQGNTTDSELNVKLQPGDVIFVPETTQQIYVLGNVAKPAIYPLKPNERVLDALVEAGGAGSGVNKAVLVRPNGTAKPLIKNLDLKKIMSRGDMKENELLQPGDKLFVPDKKTGRSPGGLLNLLYPLTSVFYLFR